MNQAQAILTNRRVDEEPFATRYRMLMPGGNVIGSQGQEPLRKYAHNLGVNVKTDWYFGPDRDALLPPDQWTHATTFYEEDGQICRRTLCGTQIPRGEDVPYDESRPSCPDCAQIAGGSVPGGWWITVVGDRFDYRETWNVFTWKMADHLVKSLTEAGCLVEIIIS